MQRLRKTAPICPRIMYMQTKVRDTLQPISVTETSWDKESCVQKLKQQHTFQILGWTPVILRSSWKMCSILVFGCSVPIPAHVRIMGAMLPQFTDKVLLTISAPIENAFISAIGCSIPISSPIEEHLYLSSNRKCFYFGNRMQHTHLISNRGTLISQLLGTACPS